MRITRLEMHGFKSFADRTVLAFGTGISCVVGPNGCGKSNVIDAMRWAIGEQSAKSLRGGDMQDIIFAGSADRKPVGYAEVGITLSSEGGDPFPGEYARFAEVHVARRLYRSGASEYLINQTRVRRKDIVDLFMDTGIGNNLYSFIEQGRIDKIVSASAEDRRSLIDEAAGITRYKKRRAEALSKLESTGGQLDRAADVADEMERRLRTLERQVVKAARFRRLRALVRQEEIFLGLVKYADLSDGRQDADAQLKDLRTQLATLEASVEALEEDLVVREGEVEVAGASAEQARDTLTEVDARRREVQAALALHEQRVEELERQLEAAQAELAADEARVLRAREELERTGNELQALETEAAKAEVDQASTTEALAVAEGQREGARAVLAELEREAGSARERRTVLASRVASLEQRHVELPQRLATVDERLGAARQEQVVVAKRVAVAEEVLRERKARCEALDAKRATLEEALEAHVRKELHARDDVKHLENELDVAQTALADAVQQAETTAGQAEEEVAARVGRAQQQVENALRDAEREDARTLGVAEAQAREVVAAEERKARASFEAAERQANQAVSGARAQDVANLDAKAQELQLAIDTTMRDGAAALEQAEAAGRERVRAVVAQARERREAAEAKLEAARQGLADVEAQLAMAVKKRRGIEGQVAALEAEERALGARDAGQRSVSEAAPDAKRLLDVLEVPSADRAWVLGALGDTMLLPLLDAKAVIDVAPAARKAGTARAVLARAKMDVASLLGDVQVVEDLAAALAHHAKTGEAAAVRASGEYIDRLGVVHLGDTGDAASAALDRRAALADLRASLLAAESQTQEFERQITQGRAAVEGASIAVRRSTDKVDAVEHEAREALDVELAALRGHTEAAVTEARRTLVGWRDTARAEADAAHAERVAARDTTLTELRAQAESVVETLRAAQQEEVATLRDELEKARDVRREASVATVDAARIAAWEEVRATTADVAVRREQLRGTVAAHKAALDKARRKAESALEGLTTARAGVTAVERERGEQDVVIARVTAERQAGTHQSQVLIERVEAYGEERAGLLTSITDVTERLAESRAELAGLSSLSTDAEARLGAAQSALATATVAADAARVARDEAANRWSEVRARRAGLHATREAAQRELASADERREGVRQRIGELEILTHDGRTAREEASTSLGALSDERQLAVAKAEAARLHFQQVREARDAVATQLREQATTQHKVREQLLAAEQAQHQVGTDLETARARIEERYQVDLPRALAQLIEASTLRLEASPEAKAGLEVAGKSVEPVDDMVIRTEMLTDEATVVSFVERIREHREQLARVGDVNLTALEEYTELDERFQDLDAQRADLETSVDSIRSAIATMNKTCRERFREAFDLVDAEFRRAYPDLVGGGEARLQLTDEEDLLETGVEILVRPPGKRMQHLGLLSGGEKAMTAIALLLALFTVKPSPFCVLDEVDAPLDEANGARFNDMIRQMSARTQFLVVTHNRKTMECADTLYGITMPTPGCSALVSVRVD